MKFQFHVESSSAWNIRSQSVNNREGKKNFGKIMIPWTWFEKSHREKWRLERSTDTHLPSVFFIPLLSVLAVTGATTTGLTIGSGPRWVNNTEGSSTWQNFRRFVFYTNLHMVEESKSHHCSQIFWESERYRAWIELTTAKAGSSLASCSLLKDDLNPFQNFIAIVSRV